ncbi:MAG: single-stranded DNA-binding protein, partial [Methylocella sp.]
IFALVAGALHRAPEAKTSKSGKGYVTAALRCQDGDASQFVRITAFSETAQAALMPLREGEYLSAQGKLEASIYAPQEGEARVSLSLVAAHIMVLRQPPKPREPKAAASQSAGRAPFEDNIPFGAP